MMKNNNKRHRKIESIQKLTSNFLNQNKIELKLFDKKIENIWNTISDKFGWLIFLLEHLQI